MSNIVIGKHTLESLTSGMYLDPYVIFREYIQNAADSIDEAIKSGILKSGEDKVEINLSPSECKIAIRDNGAGISSLIAEKSLISIGNSKKVSGSSRGFRGIGRLSALSYCTKLTFETSAYGEKSGTRVIFNAKKLSELLASNERDDLSAIDVLLNIYKMETFVEKENSHYFCVCLEGVDEKSKLNEYDEVMSYISQNVPVPYDPDGFILGKEIYRRLNQEKLAIHQYNVFVTYGNKTISIFKPYKDEFLVDKGKNLIDKITDINIIKIKQADGSIFAIGWIAKTNYLGSIYDKTIKGIRLRKGNILIGDSQTLNVIFKEGRFNGWAIGEIFAIDSKLIPNARRDNLEKNTAYFKLFEQLTPIASSITKEIRYASLNRSIELSNILNQSEQVAMLANDAIQEGFSSSKKSVIKQSITNMQSVIANSNLNSDTDVYYQEIAFEELDMLIGKLQGLTSFKAINAIKGLTKTEKKILERVFNVILFIDKDHSDVTIDAILESFSTRDDSSLE